jgi:hypothetical protein
MLATIKRHGRLLCRIAPIFLLPTVLLPALFALADGAGGYIGWKGCEACHGKVAEAWKKHRHAAAFEHLKKSGQEDLPSCLRCHSTGYGQPGGFIDNELTPELAGVQCEECHGPGRQHAAAPESGHITAAPDVATCRQCHTASQDPGFDYARKAKDVHRAP